MSPTRLLTPTPAVAANAGADPNKAWMDSGTTLLYTRKGSRTRQWLFTELMKRNPAHYGAHYSLRLHSTQRAELTTPRRPGKRSCRRRSRQRTRRREATAQQRLSAVAGPLTDTQMMNYGLYLLYTNDDPAAAGAQFRRLVKRNPITMAPRNSRRRHSIAAGKQPRLDRCGRRFCRWLRR